MMMELVKVFIYDSIFQENRLFQGLHSLHSASRHLLAYNRQYCICKCTCTCITPVINLFLTKTSVYWDASEILRTGFRVHDRRNWHSQVLGMYIVHVIVHTVHYTCTCIEIARGGKTEGKAIIFREIDVKLTWFTFFDFRKQVEIWIGVHFELII